MKKWSFILGGFLLGVAVTLSSGTVFAEVQSLIGKKVSGEMNVIVNGTKLDDKGAVIEGRTNAPVRALAASLGADLKVEGKDIIITSESTSSGEKEALIQQKKKLENSIVSITEEISKTKGKYEQARIPGTDKYEAEETWKSAIQSLENNLNLKKVELEKVNEALKQFE
ncbi:hypothetical protein QYF50_18675 [Paenibacillus vini]|uniref:hypothetical protein n=1 Tax=Paenibacillus vini TaxID=1476024 RepID=UPI0025B6AD71|nr:hypothetical protein [Paenibacillus vini]MDN4069930.1 hypothetical protein [Paenibacillus vini]